MSLGTVVKGFNAVYFRRWSELIFEVFTQIVLLMCLFGFMDLMIILKWLTNWEKYEQDHIGNQMIAPGIIQTMITMFIGFGNKVTSSKGQTQADIFCNEGMEKIGTCQKSIMLTLLAMAGLCVPLMLFVRPFWLHYKECK